MAETPNLFTTFQSAGMSKVVEPGDVALLLKKGGQCMALNFGYDANRLMLSNEVMTEEDKAMVEQGKKLFALCVAAQSEKIMALLMRIAADPDVVDFDALARVTTKH
jgi:hypothetical protein